MVAGPARGDPLEPCLGGAIAPVFGVRLAHARGFAHASPVVSNTKRSVAARLRPNSSRVLGRGLYPARDASPASFVDRGHAKSRCMSNLIALITSTSPTSTTLREPGGQNDTYRFALTAHPGKSQGRPTTPTGSQPIERRRSAQPAFSQSPVPNASDPTTGPDAPQSGSEFILMPRHQRYGTCLGGSRHLQRAA